MKLTELSLLALQTAFMQRDLTTQGMCAGLQGELRSLATDTYNILMFQALTTVGDTPFGHQLVDELAWQFHVDYYDKSADIETKKNLVKTSIKIHQKKGTPQGVIDLLKTAFPSGTVLSEWFNYGGKPYHFKITTSSLNTINIDKFLKALDSVKNERSYLDGIFLFEAILNVAISRIKLKNTIEYTAVNVGDFEHYTFPDEEVYAFGLSEKAYSFIEK